MYISGLLGTCILIYQNRHVVIMNLLIALSESFPSISFVSNVHFSGLVRTISVLQLIYRDVTID